MQLPFSLRQAIEQEATHQNLSALVQAAAELSDRYRNQQDTTDRFMTTDTHRLAYVVVRMPATFAASRTALIEIHRLAPESQIESVLDLGAGTGAASWAVAQTFDQVRQFTLLEQDNRLIEIGQKLALGSEHQSLKSANWRRANLRTTSEFAPHDLVICSYALNEIEPAAVRRILQFAWQAARQALVIVEPGTMKGFEVIRAARTQLIEAGAFIAAPCPHQALCPMAETDGGDWCHFAARFERSSLHRRLKGGTLGYEDEKFSYLAAVKHFDTQAITTAAARVLRHPKRYSGYTQLQLCTPDGLQNATVTKRDKDAWKQVRKTDWGDSWGDG
ncbi:MAG: small ribosomal subunit Rsm22 family protein [Acidobacteriota bacterium]|nr:small ribosomal subunit Rsm22 family protein [Acidobacteriota bacterium]